MWLLPMTQRRQAKGNFIQQPRRRRGTPSPPARCAGAMRVCTIAHRLRRRVGNGAPVREVRLTPNTRRGRWKACMSQDILSDSNFTRTRFLRDG
jgi:hypothetical protein